MSKYGYRGIVLFVDDISTLTQDELEQLDIGDVVVEQQDGEETTFIVNSRTASDLYLIYADSSYLKEIYYEKESGVWEYQDTLETDLSNIGGTKLYQHKITFQDVNDDHFQLYLISTDSSPLYFTDITHGLVSVVDGFDEDDLGSFQKAFKVENNGTKMVLYGINTDGSTMKYETGSEDTLGSYEDVVTPL